MRLDQPQIGRHPVAGSQQHHIAGHQHVGAKTVLAALAQDHRFTGQRSRQRRQRRLRLAFLNVTDGGVDQHHAEDHAGIDPFAEHRRDAAGENQHQHQRLHQLFGESP